MGRLLKALALAAAATGAAYLILHAIGPPDGSRSTRRRGELLDDDELTPEEKKELLRELDAYL